MSCSRKSSILAFTVAVALLCAWRNKNASAQGVFTLSSTSFKDGERLATKMAGNNKSNPNCVGENVSPALSWSNPPEGTKSFAILMFDIWTAVRPAASVTGSPTAFRRR